jgi:uncharacterized membrane protein required for colicin V production
MLALLVVLALRGAMRGLVRELAGLAAFGIGMLLAYRFAAVLGRRLEHAFPSLTPTEARVIAFIAVVVVVSFAIEIAARFLSRTIRRIPVVGALNRVGGLLAGTALALVGIWLLTTCLLLLPVSLVPSAKGVHHSQTARLVRSVPGGWSRDLRDRLERLAPLPGDRQTALDGAADSQTR